MKRITKTDYEQLGGIHHSMPMGLTTEKVWYEHDDHLGIVLLDNVDHDWSFVALAFDKRQGMGFRCFDVGTSFKTPELAEAALATAFETGPDPGFFTEDMPEADPADSLQVDRVSEKPVDDGLHRLRRR